MKRSLIVMSLIVIMLSSATALALAHEVTQWDRYSVLKVYQVTSDGNQALSWLSNNTWYKGKIWTSGPTYDWQVRYRQVMFDERITGSWLGYGYANNSAKVYECQRALGYLGYNPWANQDGVWGNTTYQAVRSFQSANGLGVDGVVGRNTWYNMVFQD